MAPMDFIGSLSGCFNGQILSGGLPFGLFLGGLVGGFSHCTAMCGPFVLSQTGHVTRFAEATLIPYHLGRLTTYIFLAILVSGLLGMTFLFLPIRSFVIVPILMTAGLIFIVNAFPSLTRVFPWALNIKMPYATFFSARILPLTFSRLQGRQSILQKYGMGLLLGFMPCGLVLSALMAAATASTPLQAGLAMAAFGAGTIPALVIAAYGGQFLKRYYPAAMKRVTQALMVWSGLWLFVLAGLLLI